MSDSDESHRGPPLRTARAWVKNSNGDGVYVVETRLLRDYKSAKGVVANLLFKKDSNSLEEKVGYLRGNLLPRPDRDFFDIADDISGELQSLAFLFCESNGRATRVRHPILQPEDGDSGAEYGGFFHIARVEVRKQHKGKDLALHMIHHTLVFLNGLWTLAVMEPGTMSRHNLKWEDNIRIQLGQQEETSADDGEKIKQGMIVVIRHYARMGFAQAGRSREKYYAWFMTARTYFGQGQVVPDEAIKRWISKERSRNVIDIYYPPERRVPSPLDGELKVAAMGFINDRGQNSDTEIFSTLENFVRRGGSIDGSHALHFASFYIRGEDVTVLDTLVRLGGDVNAADEDGNRPLHFAAEIKHAPAVRYLLSCGADKTAMNDEGSTPLDTFQKKVQDFADMAKAMGRSDLIRECDIIPKFETAKALMSQDQRDSLIDGWMPPRMFKCLLITAEIESDGLSFGESELRIEYVPMQVFRADPGAIYGVVSDAWVLIYRAIHQILRRRRAPTVARIKAQLDSNSHQSDRRKMQNYESRGGKVEFALDAVLKTTENVVKIGDDGWEYDAFEEGIEAYPATPLDEMYDVARVMCFNRGGGELEVRGPHQDAQLYGIGRGEYDDAFGEGDY